MKFKKEVSQHDVAKQYSELTILHQILCDWFANQLVIDTEELTKLLQGWQTSLDIKFTLKSDVM